MCKKNVAVVFAILITFSIYYIVKITKGVNGAMCIAEKISAVDDTAQVSEMMEESHREEAIETSTGQEKQEGQERQEVLEETKESEVQRYYREAVENAQLDWEWVIQPGEYEDFVFLGGTYIAVREENGKYRVVDEHGDSVFQEMYDSIAPYSENLALVCNEGMFFYIDTMGKKVIEGEFQDAKNFCEKKAAVQREERWGFVNLDGRVVIECQYEQVHDFREGYAAVKEENGWGVIDNNGRQIISCQYDDVKDYSEGMAAVKKDDKWGYVDENGRVVIELMYDEVGNFSEGKAAVKVGDYTEDGLDAWAYINSENRVVLGYYIDWQIPAFSMYAGEFHDGLAYIVDEVPTIIDEKGEEVFDSPFFITGYADPKYKAIPGYLFTDDLMKERRYGLVGVDGKCLLEPVFYDVNGPYGDYVRVEMMVDEKPCEGVIRLKKQSAKTE